MKNKKVSLARFTSEGRQSKRKPMYNDGLDSHTRKMKKIRKAANGCWWVELYLRDRCNVVKTEGVKCIGKI